MHSLNSLRTSLAAHWPSLAGLAGALALSACLTDSPNRTGGGYLERHGLLLETPLHRIEVKGFPVESVFTGDLESARLHDSLVLAGRWRGFTSDVRLAFDLADTNHVDSLSPSDTLRLSLGLPLPNRGDDELKAMVKDVESMTFKVESWAYGFDFADKNRPDSLYALNRRFLVRQDTAPLFRSDAASLDTLRVQVKTAYEKAGGRDSIQVFALPNLGAKLHEGSGSGRRWLVLMQLTRIPRDSTDTAAAMLRLGGRYGSLFTPMLLFGKADGTARHPATATDKQKRYPMEFQDELAVVSRYGHTGSTTAMLTGKTRGLHLRLNRDRLLDSLDEALRRLGSSLARASDGEFDLGYYVPFAQMTVPLAAPSVIEGGFPLDIRLVSDLDSALPGDTLGNERYLPKGRDEVAAVLSDRNSAGRATDTVKIRFEEAAAVPDMNRFIVWGKDTAHKDTTFLRDGESREVLRSLSSGGNNRLVLTVRALGDTLGYRVHVNAQAREEGHLFRDAATGTPLDEIAQRLPAFLKPEDSALTLRATTGFQRMLNRERLGEELASDFFIQPIRFAGADTASERMLPYPVLGEIEPKTAAGRLGVDIVLYLYPLKVRR